MKGLESEKENLVVDPVFNWEPGKQMEHKSDVMSGRGLGNYAGGRVLNQLKSMESFLWQVKQKGIAVIQSGGN